MKLNAIILLLASTAPVAFVKAFPVAGNNVAVTECVMKVPAGGWRRHLSSMSPVYFSLSASVLLTQYN
jgi:hypothetical protein